MNERVSLLAMSLEWSENAAILTIWAGLCAGLFAAVVLIINALCRRWLSSRQMGLLWGMVLLRLLIPVAPSTSLSLQNLFPTAQTEMTEPIDINLQPDGDSRSVVDASTPGDSHSRASAASQTTSLSVAVDRFFTTLPLIWLVGGGAFLIWTTTFHLQFCRRLKHIKVCDDPMLRGLWKKCCKQAGVRKTIPILLFDGVQQPAILGLFRPTLLLPTHTANLNEQQLRMIMLHELAHVKHWDIAANWVLVVIRAIHWWNPVYWLASARFQSLREQSCDAFAIRRIEGQPTRDYSELLLTLAQRPQSGPPWRVMLPASILGFFSSFFRKRAVHNRLKALSSAAVLRSRWHTAAFAGLVGMVGICGLTDARTRDTSLELSSDWLPIADRYGDNSHATPEIYPGPPVTRTYNIEKALDRIAAVSSTNDDAQKHVYHLLTHIVRSSTGHYQAVTNEWAQQHFRIDGATLTVDAPLDVQAEIVRNLAAWEQSGLGQICVETRIITDERDIASAFGISWQYLEAFSADREEDVPSKAKIGMPVVRAKAVVDESLPIAVATLNGQQAFALVQAVQGQRRANVLQAPKVTLFNGQLASIVDRTQTPVCGWNAKRQHGCSATENRGHRRRIKADIARDSK
jgi:bla regulator protein blaR1